MSRRPTVRAIPWLDMDNQQRKDHLRLAHRADTRTYGITARDDMWHGLSHAAGPLVPHTHDKDARAR